MNTYHALGLHMHQLPGYLDHLIETYEFEAEQIIRCYERAVRYAHNFKDVGRLHVSFSGVLLEQFQNSKIVDRYRRFIDIPAMLASYRSATNIEIIGMGYSHPIFPLIPIEDWKEQLNKDRKIMQKIFGRAPQGFWPPEMVFCMEMVPALVEAGYEYVIVDAAHIQPQDGDYDFYRPYKATYNGATIAVVPRERSISNGQESGMNQKWFADQVADKVWHSPHPAEPRLVTTWSNGENGGWFLQMHEESGFFGHFFKPYLEGVKSGDIQIQPILLGEYLQEHPPVQEAARVGAWNVDSAPEGDFSRWIRSKTQREAVEAIRNASKRYWTLADPANKTRLSADARSKLAKARDLILESETSDFLFGGDTWVSTKFKECIGSADELLAKAEATVNP
jgi:alpha-amylase/alpha-mannosidase (GH57 family)